MGEVIREFGGYHLGRTTFWLTPPGAATDKPPVIVGFLRLDGAVVADAFSGLD
jgi:hypothetical protein